MPPPSNRLKPTPARHPLSRVQTRALAEQERHKVYPGKDPRAMRVVRKVVRGPSHHHRQLLADNQNNRQPIRALFRVDVGFASQENIAWFIEMGYDVDTKARSIGVRDTLLAAGTDETVWQRVGGNATLTAWAQTTLDGAFVYPVNLALARYQTGFGAFQLPLPLFRNIQFCHF